MSDPFSGLLHPPRNRPLSGAPHKHAAVGRVHLMRDEEDRPSQRLATAAAPVPPPPGPRPTMPPIGASMAYDSAPATLHLSDGTAIEVRLALPRVVYVDNVAEPEPEPAKARAPRPPKGTIRTFEPKRRGRGELLPLEPGQTRRRRAKVPPPAGPLERLMAEVRAKATIGPDTNKPIVKVRAISEPMAPARRPAPAPTMTYAEAVAIRERARRRQPVSMDDITTANFVVALHRAQTAAAMARGEL